MEPHLTSKADPYIMDAFKALEAGNANDIQQKQALDWLIHHICLTYDMSYRPGDTHATAFAEGKRAVGLEIITMLKVNTTILRRNDEQIQQAKQA